MVGWASSRRQRHHRHPDGVYNPAAATSRCTRPGPTARWREYYWNAAKGWSHQSLGGSITGSPSAVYNPVSENLEVYATGTGKNLQKTTGTPDRAGRAGRAWAADITGSPSAVYDPLNTDLEVYAHSAAGTLWEAWWGTGSGWKHPGPGRLHRRQPGRGLRPGRRQTSRCTRPVRRGAGGVLLEQHCRMAVPEPGRLHHRHPQRGV